MCNQILQWFYCILKHLICYLRQHRNLNKFYDFWIVLNERLKFCIKIFLFILTCQKSKNSHCWFTLFESLSNLFVTKRWLLWWQYSIIWKGVCHYNYFTSLIVLRYYTWCKRQGWSQSSLTASFYILHS